MILNVVECVWAFDGIMFGATALGAGLIMTGGAAVLTAAVGVGAIVGSAFYVKNIGDRFYNSTQLMNAYLDGDKEAGEKLVENAQIHFVFVAAGTQFSDALSGLTSSVFAETHLGEKIGSFFAEAFERTSIGCDGALEILNRISPKYTEILTRLINQYGSNIADDIAKIDDLAGINGIEETLNTIDDTVKSVKELGVSSENIAKIELQITEAKANSSKFTKPSLSTGSAPKGNYATPSNPNDAINVESINRQNKAADLLASNGYDITMLPEVNGGNGYGITPESNPDFLIDGVAFDCYSPTSSRPRNVWYNVKEKTEEQAARVILNLDGYESATLDEVASQFLDWNIISLDEMFIIKDGKIIRLIIK